MELGPDVQEKATKVDNKEVQPEMGPTKFDNKEIQPEMGPGPNEETQGEKVPSRVRLRTKTPDEFQQYEGGGGRESCRNEQQGARRCH